MSNATANGVKFEVQQAKGVPDGSEWVVEAIDYEDEGQCYVARFSGPHAEYRALEYADWKNDCVRRTRGLWAVKRC